MNQPTETRNRDFCPLCLRTNATRPVREMVFRNDRGIVLVRGRFCAPTVLNLAQSCPSIFPPERKASLPGGDGDPSLRERWCRLPRDPSLLDAGVRNAILRCADAGLGTFSSCDGHGRSPGYLTFWTEEERNCALVLLADLEPSPEDVLARGLVSPFHHRIRIPVERLQWTPHREQRSGQ